MVSSTNEYYLVCVIHHLSYVRELLQIVVEYGRLDMENADDMAWIKTQLKATGVLLELETERENDREFGMSTRAFVGQLNLVPVGFE